VALVADTGAVYALFDARDKHHKAVRKAVETEAGAILQPVPRSASGF
jgi:predicted nucleic acid-binding protein